MDGVKKVNVSAATHVPTFLMPAAEKALELREEIEVMEDAFAERRVAIRRSPPCLASSCLNGKERSTFCATSPERA